MELCLSLDSPESGVIDALAGDVDYFSGEEIRRIFVIKKEELGQPFSEVICG
jgi:hypothetical protein